MVERMPIYLPKLRPMEAFLAKNRGISSTTPMALHGNVATGEIIHNSAHITIRLFTEITFEQKINTKKGNS